QAIVEGLQEKRWQIVGLKVGKATARGLSIYLVVHSAGLTHEDLVLAPAADAVCKALIDHLLGRRSREDLEREVAARRQARFEAFLGEVLLDDFEASLPASHRPGFVAAARAAAAGLAAAAEARA
ncbi:MAG: hypothetical protein HYU66_29725, partial [Armatimonadetes bacterium]|nr:hypothetical protein [Armatimonadota bacterium]